MNIQHIQQAVTQLDDAKVQVMEIVNMLVEELGQGASDPVWDADDAFDAAFDGLRNAIFMGTTLAHVVFAESIDEVRRLSPDRSVSACIFSVSGVLERKFGEMSIDGRVLSFKADGNVVRVVTPDGAAVALCVDDVASEYRGQLDDEFIIKAFSSEERGDQWCLRHLGITPRRISKDQLLEGQHVNQFF